MRRGKKKLLFRGIATGTKSSASPCAKNTGMFLLRRMASTVEQTSRQRRKPCKNRKHDQNCLYQLHELFPRHPLFLNEL